MFYMLNSTEELQQFININSIISLEFDFNDNIGYISLSDGESISLDYLEYEKIMNFISVKGNLYVSKKN